MSFKDDLNNLRKGMKASGAKTRVLEKAKKGYGHVKDSDMHHSPGYGHMLGEEKRKGNINKRKSPLLKSLEK